VGILNSDGEEKSKRGDSSESKHDNSGGVSDHKVSGEEGELVNDGRGDAWHGSPKLNVSFHEVNDVPFSIWLSAVRDSTHALGCSGNSGCVFAGGLTIPKKVN